ncbi:MAG TPA: amidohydrolase family protein [Desulfotomaculum sp.]|nr:amidohydrolase family protein [Desulfotomaculum sp.]
MNEALALGISISSDVYPFTRGSSSILSLFPPWTLQDGVNSLLRFLRDPETRKKVATDLERGCPGWESRVAIMGWDRIWIGAVKKKENGWVAGRSVADSAREVRLPPVDFLIGLMLSEARDFSYTGEISSLDDVETMMAHPFTLVGTDGIHVTDGIPHPRLYGTFPRTFDLFVKKSRLLSWESAIYRMTKLAAQVFGLREVGVLHKGYYADIVVFDPENISYEEAYNRPPASETGIRHVFVTGKAVVQDGKLTGVVAGRVMRHKR